MTTLTVDLEAIAANWRWLRAQHGRPIAAVLKADAYGLGAERVAQRLFAEGARHFFTAYPQEGAALRPLLAGAAPGHMPGPMIAILNGLLAGQAELYVRHDLAPVLGNLDEVAAWSAQATRLGRRLPALIHIDTGMNRLGLGAADVARLTAEPDLLRGIETLFVMTHLANADTPDDPLNAAQARALGDCGGLLPGVPRSLANSSGLLVGSALASDLGRPGAAVYGINPTPGTANPMRTVLRLTAPVLQLRDIGVGEAVGYNGIWVAQRPTRVATVSAGYADGYHRILSNRAEASFDGGRLPLIGRVSMDLATFDATDCPGLRQGDELELIGPAVPPDEVAAWAGTNGYEVLTSLKPRGGRVYASL